jgi:hypothetical protein
MDVGKLLKPSKVCRECEKPAQGGKDPRFLGACCRCYGWVCQECLKNHLALCELAGKTGLSTFLKGDDRVYWTITKDLTNRRNA